MAKAKLSDKIFHDEDAARAHFEALRWADGRVCPHCGTVDNSVLLKGKSTRPGLYKCRDCRKPFSATIGTIYERSHIPLHKWLLATHLMCASKKGMSAKQLYRMLGFGSYRTAWFMAHRIREAMAPAKGSVGPLGGKGKAVEADETLIGGKERNKHVGKRKPGNIGAVGKQVAFSLVERGGSVRSFHVGNVTGATLRPIIVTQIDRASTLMTDEAGQYRHVGKEFARHGKVNHGIEEYVRGDCHTNTIEGYFSILKRGIVGTYHHVSEAHLKRYLAEFDFRYNHREAVGVNDTERTDAAIAGTVGKRLTYRQPLQA